MLTKLNNKAVANVTSIPVALGDMVLVSSATASSSASIEFTLGNYKEYQFYFVDIHPQNNNVNFTFNLSTDNGSNYNVIKTTTAFRTFHSESDASANLSYDTGSDLAQSTGEQFISPSVGNENDESTAGTLQLFNPSSNTYVKHWVSRFSDVHEQPASIDWFTAGYANTVSPLTNIRFQMASGNIDAGTILMYGIN